MQPGMTRALSACRDFCRRHPVRAGLALLLTLALVADRLFPPPLPRDEPGLVVAAADGTPLRSWPSSGGVWRYPVTPEQVSPAYLEALFGYEDRWFGWHPGVNPFALGRAAWQWLSQGRIVSGGSTLTMQVARIVEKPPRTLAGKLRQVLRAMQLELRLSKREILTLYLNHAPMGGIVEGVEMASRAYLGKSSAQLSRAEAALLVVLPQAPSRLRPDRYPEAAQAARDKVLLRMGRRGLWSPADVDDARIERVASNPLRAHWLAPLAAERLRRDARNDAGKPMVVVQSTLDRALQAQLERQLADRVAQLPPHVSMAAMIMETDTLLVRAYAGSADFSDPRRFSQVDMVRGVRSPGSTLKPFLYAMALDEGLIHSESLLADAPQAFGGYEPGNFQSNFSGPVSVSEALQRSLNVPAVDLLDRLGPARFASHLRAAGLRLRTGAGVTPNLSLILGGAGTTLEELVGAYRALGAGGLAGQPRLTPDAPRIERRLMSEGAAFIVRDILEAGGRPERPFHDGSGPPLAWKTGTSFGFRDAWAVGVAGGYTLGVWVGRPDGTPNPGFFGANIAAPLLRDMAATLPRGAPATRRPPASVSSGVICWPLGMAADSTPPALCHEKRTAWLLNQTIPPTLPDRVRKRSLRETIWIDPASGLRSVPSCSPHAEPREVARWPALLEPWLDGAERRHNALPPWQAECSQRAEGALRLAGLAPGSRVRPAPGKPQARISVQAIGARGELYWLLDGKPLGPPSPRPELSFTVTAPGDHRLTVMDGHGNHDAVAFTLSVGTRPRDP